MYLLKIFVYCNRKKNEVEKWKKECKVRPQTIRFSFLALWLLLWEIQRNRLHLSTCYICVYHESLQNALIFSSSIIIIATRNTKNQIRYVNSHICVYESPKNAKFSTTLPNPIQLSVLVLWSLPQEYKETDMSRCFILSASILSLSTYAHPFSLSLCALLCLSFSECPNGHRYTIGEVSIISVHITSKTVPNNNTESACSKNRQMKDGRKYTPNTDTITLHTLFITHTSLTRIHFTTAISHMYWPVNIQFIYDKLFLTERPTVYYSVALLTCPGPAHPILHEITLMQYFVSVYLHHWPPHTWTVSYESICMAGHSGIFFIHMQYSLQ